MYWYFNSLCFAMRIKWFESLFSNDFSMIWMKIHFAKEFWQIAQIFSIVSIFWICRYCYESSKAWSDWCLSLKMLTKSNDRNQNSLYWNDLHSQFCFEIFNFFKFEFAFQIEQCNDNRIIQSVMIAIFSCIIYSFLFDLFFVQIFRRIDFTFKSNIENVIARWVVELLDC